MMESFGMRLMIALVFASLSAVGQAETWNCRNADMEIGCSEGRCEATIGHGFTPMGVAFNDDGEVSICAYSGCWEGQGEVTRSELFVSITASNLTYSTDTEPGTMRQDAAILLDLSDNIALLKLGTYAQPLVCKVLSE